MTSGPMDDREEFLTSEIQALELVIRDREQKIRDAQETISLLESVIHKASRIAGHMPYLCRDIEGSENLETAAMQLQRILLHREG